MTNSPSFSAVTTIAGPLFGLAVIVVAATTIVAPSAALAQTEATNKPVAEFTRAQAETRANAAFDRIDANADGVIDSEDQTAMRRARFDAMDADGNGEISFTEFEAIRGERRAGLAEMRGNRGGGQRGENRRGGGRPEGRRGGGRDGAGSPKMIRLADADANGKVSKEEFAAVALQRFDRMDANDDGTITADERRSRKGGMRGMGRFGGRS